MIYNSRNYQSLLAAIIPPFKIQVDLQQQKLLELTSLFPHPRRVSDLQQQKLLELTSLADYKNGFCAIYNSRNYQSLLAQSTAKPGRQYLQQQKLLELTSLIGARMPMSLSTIVEIIRAYQPSVPSSFIISVSTIVEIIRAYQPHRVQKRQDMVSTIVEIIRAYQPFVYAAHGTRIYNSRNYQSLLAAKVVLSAEQLIYNSRNYQSLLAFIRYIF